MRSYRKVKDHFELRIDSSRLTLLGVGAGLVLLLVFLLGVLVGKGVWGGRRVAPVPLAPLPRAQVDTLPSTAREEVRPKQELTFYEDLKKPDRPVADGSPPPDPPAAAARKAPTLAPEPGPKTADPPQPEVQAGAGPAAPTAPREARPTAAAAAERTVAAPLPAPVFTVQVGSFREPKAAAELAAKVAGQGVDAQVVAAAVAGRTWYRVQVGRFSTRSAAEAHFGSRLRPRGIQGFVTTR